MKNFAETNVPMTEAQISDELSADELGTEDLEQVSGGLAPLVGGLIVGGIFAYGAYRGYKQGEAEEAAQCR